MRHTAAKALAAVAITAALTTVAAVPASADPTVTPAAKDIVGVGSDTTQALFTKFSADYNATIPATDTTTPRLYSWDATGTSPITPKTGGATIARPNGSGAGISALAANTNATLDFARSSRAAQATDPSTLDFIAFAKDAVTWSATVNGHAPANLTTANLVDIYTCAKTDWSQFGGTAGTIKAYLPQSGSGTRSFFLQALGNITPGNCVVSGPEENEGTDSAFTGNLDAIFPYSVGHYVGQLNGHTTATDAPGQLTLRNINGVTPLTATNTLNPAFAGGSYGRVLFNVVRDADYTATTTQGTALRAIFSNGGWICSTAGRNDIASYGFLNLPATGCGVIIH
ncbi:PstS family phosphate ABC transporter substrate-binding protein [Kitasatospora sp. NPDC059795]|uniref:PstS family phosphate ABC transporter substrate-binding protein n=1 Tax=Kitasatospora sp. NPDC059795 TaxID=3346949 RepID=UPI00365A6296